MATISFILLLLSLFHTFHSCFASGNPVIIGKSRETLEIIIGGGGYTPPPESQECPPPPPPEPLCPPPPSPLGSRQKSPPPPPPPPSPPSPPPPTLPPPPPPTPLPPPSLPPSPPPPSPPPPPSLPPKSPPPPSLPPLSLPPPSPPPPPLSLPSSPPPLPPLKSPPPSQPSAYPFESLRLKIVYPIIQKFKKKIEHDPHNITATWTGKDICHKYKGFKCAMVPDKKVKALAVVNFNGYRFGGKDLNLEGFLDELPDVTIFHANTNNFVGTIPKKISTLRYFYEFDLSNNKLDGKFPTEVLAATKLTFLDLRFNNFSGYVPPEVFKLDLDALFINNNKLVQNLPENLGSTGVHYLTLANNKFIGPIPKSIGQASKTLFEVLFLNNQLSGCLPYEIGLLRNASVLDVSLNQLTGPIPYSFGCLTKMEILNLTKNMFYGPVPEMACELPSLKKFTLSFNYFTQVGPMCRKLIKEKKLDVKMNCISNLPMQRSAADCAAFFSKPKYCPNMASFGWMPCKKNGRSDSPERKLMARDAPRISYGALTAH